MSRPRMIEPSTTQQIEPRPRSIEARPSCPILAAASWWRLRALDRAVGDLDVHVELLQHVPMLHTLPLPSIEQLARGLEPVTVPAGTPVFGQGEVGNRFYVIEDGAAEVVGDGRVVATLGPGEGFGEIALLRRTRRTASVVATKASQQCEPTIAPETMVGGPKCVISPASMKAISASARKAMTIGASGGRYAASTGSPCAARHGRLSAPYQTAPMIHAATAAAATA